MSAGESSRFDWWRACAVYTAASGVGVVAAGAAIAWSYGRFTELDRPDVVRTVPFLAGAALWSIACGVAVLARDGLSPTRRAIEVALAAEAALFVALVVFAPETPLHQGVGAAVCALAVPLIAWAALAFPGVPLLLVRGVVAAMAGGASVLGIALLALIAVSRGYALGAVLAMGLAAIHLPVTLFSSVIHRRLERESGAGTAPARPLWPQRLVAVVAAAGAVLLAVGVAATPQAPADADPVLKDVAGAHRDLNRAVGWDAWNPEALDGTSTRLRRAAALTGNGAPELVEAADRIVVARNRDDRDEAVAAHQIVAGFERRAREARALLDG